MNDEAHLSDCVDLLLRLRALLGNLWYCHRLRASEASFARLGVVISEEVGSEMGSEAFKSAMIYRQLLKAVKKHISKDESKRHFQDFITSEFRKNSTLSDGVAVQQKIKLARDYTFLLNSVHHHKDLLFSYNIAVDRSDEMKKILGKSAASVGLRLPEVYQP
ncbi:hypothetical protein L6164_007097 [Bauhinia variegata]|uniref:Uncharacterized protein n=1 Tax=Bauhinia variegata TaxID=167791 RepID=A0ACB9PWM2_BAUVA|nr:hypothetical protein L6164_007097 [Bauhinia variegata]